MTRRAAPLLAVVLLAGCGGAASREVAPRTPHLPRALADPWRAQAEGVASALAAGDSCLALQLAVALRTSVIDAVNARRLPPRFQEQLLAGANDLAARITCVAPPQPQQPVGPGKGHDKHGNHDKHGKGGH